MGAEVERFESLPEESQRILNHIGQMMGGNSVWFPGEHDYAGQWIRRFKDTFVTVNFKETLVAIDLDRVVVDLMDPNCFAKLERALLKPSKNKEHIRYY